MLGGQYLQRRPPAMSNISAVVQADSVVYLVPFS
jgi:hypothetical protein